MRTFTSADAKNNFGELIDVARAAPDNITKYYRPVVAVMAVKEFGRLKALDAPVSARCGRRRTMLGRASTPAVIMTLPPEKLRRKASVSFCWRWRPESAH